MNWGAIFERAYSQFFLRDFLGKIVPGALVLVAATVAVQEQSVEESVTALSDVHAVAVVILLGLSWLLGFVAQGVRELLERLAISVGLSRRVNWPQVVAARIGVDEEQRQELERLAVIKEATGNFLGAVPLIAVGLTQGAQWGGSHAVLAIVVGVLLLHRFMDARRRELDLQQVFQQNGLIQGGIGGDVWGTGFLRRFAGEPAH